MKSYITGKPLLQATFTGITAHDSIIYIIHFMGQFMGLYDNGMGSGSETSLNGQ